MVAVPSSLEARSGLLALNRALAGALGMDPDFTISTNVARRVSDNTGLSFRTAKLGFHASVGGAAALGAQALGADPWVAVGIGLVTCLWLESFDSSRKRW